ncbi:hypothetical protein B566_EDAN004769, partial [Ephemera danica]
MEVLRWNGWGYIDTSFICDENGDTSITKFMNQIKKLNIAYSIEGPDRLYRVHGMTLRELITLREGTFERIPDIVTWPNCHDDVVKLVQLASKLNVVLVPFGGGTNATRALECNGDEKRMIVSLDTSQMNRLLWVDKANLMACCEAGIMGQDLKAALMKHEVTIGHEPDSIEFSTMGGWVATRASGMKKNQYGNIEDLVVHVKFVTPSGVLERSNLAPRVSCGPDLNHLALGSEGTLGVVTEVTFKIRPVPEVEEFDSFVFPTFQHGVDFMREVARKRCQPASLRFVDNEQFKMGQLFKEKLTWVGSVIDSLKMFYVTKYKGIDLDTMCAAIAVMQLMWQYQNRKLQQLHPSSMVSVVVLRMENVDLLLSHSILGDSFETSLPWDRVALVCRNVKSLVNKKCQEFGIQYFLTTCRVTQVYDTGSCVYFYVVFNSEGVENALQKYEAIENAARAEILRCGGSLSHHHGVGKQRNDLYPSQVSPVGVTVFRAVKQALDPNNVFACGNILPQNDDQMGHTISSNG